MANVSTNPSGGSTPPNALASEPIPGDERQQIDDEDVGSGIANLDEGSDYGSNDFPDDKTEAERRVEADARKEGWVPKEEWHSNKPWKPADEFLDFKRKYIPAIKEETSKLQRELTELRRER